MRDDWCWYWEVRADTNQQPQMLVTNTFFYSKLMEDGVYSYSNVRRWTSTLNVFALDKVIIPINDNNAHWFLAVVDFRKK